MLMEQALLSEAHAACLVRGIQKMKAVTDRRNRAGDDRLNEATQSSPETQFRMFSRMRFFA